MAVAVAPAPASPDRFSGRLPPVASLAAPEMPSDSLSVAVSIHPSFSSLVCSSDADASPLMAASSPPTPSCLTLTGAFPYSPRVAPHHVTLSPKDLATRVPMGLRGGGRAYRNPCA